MARAFRRLMVAVGIANGATLYTLRLSVTTAMKHANPPHLEMSYLTSHRTDDVLNQCTSLDPVRAMGLCFDAIRPLLVAIWERSTVLGLAEA